MRPVAELKPKTWIFGPEPTELVNAKDFIPNLGISTIDLDTSPHILAVGKSRSGKSSFISRLICHHFIHVVPVENIVIFSPSFESDHSFDRLRWTLRKIQEKKTSGVKLIGEKDGEKPNFYRSIDLKRIKEI